MKTTIVLSTVVILPLCFILSGCAGAALGPREEAVNKAWYDFCSSGYCEGHQSQILSRTDNTLTVNVNGNMRYIEYRVTGELGNYNVRMYPTGYSEKAALPIPLGTSIFTPPSNVPSDLASFSGVWSGYWGGVLPSLLIVETIDAKGSARGIYAWGDDPSGKFAAGNSHFVATIRNGLLSWGDKTVFVFKMSGDGQLSGTRYADGRSSGTVTMVRVGK